MIGLKTAGFVDSVMGYHVLRSNRSFQYLGGGAEREIDRPLVWL